LTSFNSVFAGPILPFQAPVMVWDFPWKNTSPEAIIIGMLIVFKRLILKVITIKNGFSGDIFYIKFLLTSAAFRYSISLRYGISHPPVHRYSISGDIEYLDI